MRVCSVCDAHIWNGPGVPPETNDLAWVSGPNPPAWGRVYYRTSTIYVCGALDLDRKVQTVAHELGHYYANQWFGDTGEPAAELLGQFLLRALRSDLLIAVDNTVLS